MAGRTLREYNMTYAPSELNMTDLYSAFLPILNSAQVELPDHAKLLAQRQRLARRRKALLETAGWAIATAAAPATAAGSLPLSDAANCFRPPLVT